MPVSADRAGRLVEINEGSGLTSRVQVCRQPANRSQRWRDAHSPALTEPRSPVFKALAPISINSRSAQELSEDGASSARIQDFCITTVGLGVCTRI